MRYKIATLAAAVVFGGVQAAAAADMAVKAPYAPAVPLAYNWSGIYGGVNFGWVGENSTWTYTNPVPATPPTSSAHDVRRDDAIIGAHIGLQYQWQQIVLGVEASVSSPTSRAFGVSNVQCVSVVGSLCEVQMRTLAAAAQLDRHLPLTRLRQTKATRASAAKIRKPGW